LFKQIEVKLKIKYQSPRFVEEMLLYLKEKEMESHPTVNITFEQNDDDFLKIHVESIDSVEPFLKTLDTLLIHIREKEEMQSKGKYHSK